MAIPSISTQVTASLEMAQKSPSVSQGVTAARPIAAPVETAARVQQPAPIPSVGELENALETINKLMQMEPPGLVFSVDPDSNRTIVKVIDKQTQEVLRQIPSEEALAISKSLDQLTGLLVRQQA